MFVIRKDKHQIISDEGFIYTWTLFKIVDVERLTAHMTDVAWETRLRFPCEVPVATFTSRLRAQKALDQLVAANDLVGRTKSLSSGWILLNNL